MKRQPEKGFLFWKKRWFSFCSIHYYYDENCHLCRSGNWSNVYFYSFEKLIYKNFPKIWKWFKRVKRNYYLVKKIDNLKSQAKKEKNLLPNDWSIDLTRKVINKLLKEKKVELEFLNPSNEGGTLIEFYHNDIRYTLEIFNDQEIVILYRKNGKRKAFDSNENDIFDFIEKEMV